MSLTRWTDDRLDDLHATVKANDHRLDTVQDMTQTNDRRLADIEKNKSTAQTFHMNKQMLYATWAAPVISAVLFVLAIFFK